MSTPELQRTLDAVARAGGLTFTGQIVISQLGTRFARTDGHRIDVDPEALEWLSVNSWAFVLAHELAHLVDPRARSAGTQREWVADAVGSDLAICAGFDPWPFVEQLSRGPDGQGHVRGETRVRLQRLIRHLENGGDRPDCAALRRRLGGNG